MMRLAVLRVILSLGLAVLSAPSGHAQDKMACELITKAEAEGIVGVPLLPLRPYAPFRSLLENRDFAYGKIDEGCAFTNYSPTQPPVKVVAFNIEVRYSSTPNPRAVDEARRQVDERTRDHPTDLPDLGDAAFWIGAPINPTVFVFRGGTMRLMIGPSQIGLEKEKAIALKVLGGSGKTNTSYGAPRTLAKPVLTAGGRNPSPADQLKRDLTVKADRNDSKAQLALARLYQFGTLAADGTPKPDYAGAAFWYLEASDRGDAQAAFELALLYRDGLGMPANPSVALDLLRKAADAGFVPAMAPLSLAYAEAKTATSQERGTYWATRAAEAGDPRGWYILGYEYTRGWLGGDPAFAYRAAMDAYTKAVNGGVCIAMMGISALYSNGQGVPKDAALAREWSVKADSCHAKEMDSLWVQSAKLRSMADGGRLPAVGERVAAAPPGGYRLPTNDKFLALMGSLVAASVAYAELHPEEQGSAGEPDLAKRWRQDDLDRQNWQKLAAPMPKIR
jgi:hypothetical protein